MHNNRVLTIAFVIGFIRRTPNLDDRFVTKANVLIMGYCLRFIPGNKNLFKDALYVIRIY